MAALAACPECERWKSIAMTIGTNAEDDAARRVRLAWTDGFDRGFGAVDEAIEVLTTALRGIAGSPLDAEGMREAARGALARWGGYKGAHKQHHRTRR